MKKIVMYFFTGMFLMFLFSNSFAQTDSSTTKIPQTKTVEKQTADLVAEMTKVATLTTEQIEKITPFITEFFKQKETDLTENAGNNEKLLAAAKARKENLVKNLKTILTEEQLNTLIQYFNNKESKSSENETKTTE